MATLIRRELRCSTRCYEAVHCRRPRGEALWWFDIALPSGLHIHFHKHAAYGLAAQAALAEARRLHACEVRLAP